MIEIKMVSAFTDILKIYFCSKNIRKTTINAVLSIDREVSILIN